MKPPKVDIPPTEPFTLFRTRMSFENSGTVGSGGPRDYDVTPDGQLFLVNQHVADSTDSPITIVVNWTKLLTK